MGVENKEARSFTAEPDQMSAMPLLEEVLRDQTQLQALAQRHRLDRDLEELKRRSKVVEAATPLGLFESDGRGIVRYVSPGFVQLTGFTIDKMGGRTWCDVLLPRTDPPMVRDCEDTVQRQRPWRAAMQLNRADGSSLWANLDVVPKLDDEGAFSGHIVVFADLGRQQELLQQLQDSERRLKEARDEAELAAHRKAKFLDAASHDLRQPLQAASLLISVLQNRVSEEQRRLILEKLQVSLDALDNLLTALVEVSELEVELGQPTESIFPIRELFLQLINEFAPHAAARKLRLRVIAPLFYLRTDCAYLRRLLRNLLTNALSCSAGSDVLLGARRSGKNLRIEIWDAGKGDSRHEQNKVTKYFDRSGNEYRDEGLEIARAKRIAKLLDSHLTVRRGSGGYWVSALELPLALVPKPMPSLSIASQQAQYSSSKVIVVIDDKVSVQESLALLLANWGLSPVVDSTAAGILGQLAQRQISPDLVIADYQLASGQIGTKAIEEIRQSCGERIPAILLTGNTAPKQHGSAQQTSYILLHKPIGPEHLQVILGSLLGN